MSAPASAMAPAEDVPMTHRQKIEALIGLLLGMFVAFLSSTVVSNALPTIITDLHGTQDQYTWVITATLLASTATTPIWGKFADLVSKKLLVQGALFLFTLGSVLAGLSTSVDMLIGFRVIQGLGLGGLQALVVIVVATMFSPRERGRYQGPMAAVMSVATVAGPLIGGVIVDTSWLGWRWTFYVCVPLAVIALLVIQRTLNVPVVRKKVSIDYLGAALIASGVSTLLIWVTLAGKNFDWASLTSYGLVALGVVLLALAIFVESKVSSPIIPLHIFRDRTTTLATLASVGVGVALFGGAVFLGQYFQIARGYSPTAAGLLTLPMVIGSMLSATVSGNLITRYGRWKRFLVAGAAMMTIGFGLLATIDAHTDMVVVGVFLFILGCGMGMTMQNLVLAVQNNVSPDNLGAATSTVTFFRSLGGAAGVSVLGAVLSNHVTDLIAKGLGALGIGAGASSGGSAGLANLNELPAPIAAIVRGAYGDGTARVFLVAAVMAALSFIAIAFIKEVALKTMSSDEERRAQEAAVADVAVPAAVAPAAVGPVADDAIAGETRTGDATRAR
ncbi:MDR family MFS transporter [Gordonia hongkongensis]|uniref:MDR family MFS transporter n=3 Tax=Gordonia TaxID=2053 RepID=A0AAX3T974_9ACTN|nr:MULTISPECIES: MDR family MFS transporter [Gordonia]OCW86903.1 EmrB/QacA family drug resistance transporter [Nocardia farcinica]QIK49569.1 MFS transporter [Gordonia terrae]MBN0973838.1 MFS transporter [Gordonia sp. BP-119]MBN0983735.1 MFS transporter [Gordonia sp. BP-94]MBR7192479.1 MFS transporter [Gordonia sp. SCSIO 19800]